LDAPGSFDRTGLYGLSNDDDRTDTPTAAAR